MHNEPSTGTTERTFIEAIAQRWVVTAVYNGAPLALAPHSLFARHGALFVSAVNMSKTRRDDEEQRLGIFKVTGLSEVVVTGESFDLAVADLQVGLRPND
ncbi:hypothetical protein QUT48_23015, partial [Xanthomonas citri pv. citri]